jgi:hypothetical protein
MVPKIKTGVFFLVAVSALVAQTGCDADRHPAFSATAPHLANYRPPLLPDPQLHNTVFSKADLPYQNAVRAPLDGYGDTENQGTPSH